MDYERFTLKAQEAVQTAATEARNRANPEVVPAHLLYALLGSAEGIIYPVVTRLGATPAELRSAAEQVLSTVPTAHGATAQPTLSRGLVAVLDSAEQAARGLGDDYTSTEHLLL
ncbi:MAG: hypothetical protein H0V19_02615, partial [Euzebyales bacterium]|nr:hypothetical protein [Euzebyales bacterium]